MTYNQHNIYIYIHTQYIHALELYTFSRNPKINKQVRDDCEWV